MGDYSSLLFFTILSQAAVGIMLMEAFRDEKHVGVYWTAAVLTALGALSSLGHLGDPWICWRTLGNLGSSWLSREIGMCIVFGASVLACIFYWRRWMVWLSAALGILFIYVMARVYMLPTEPVWHSCLTFIYFLMAAIMLGASLLLVCGKYDDASHNPLLSWLPVVLMGAMCISALTAFLRLPEIPAPAHAAQAWYIALLVAGAGVALPLIMRAEAREKAGDLAPKAGPHLCVIGVAALIWVAEFCGRVSFYKSFAWFGM